MPHTQSLIAESLIPSATLLVADGQCPKIRELLANAKVPLLWLGDEKDPLKIISETLAGRREQGQRVQALHWVSHGNPGVLQVGQQRVDHPALVAASDQLIHWQVDQLALWACEYGADNSALSPVSYTHLDAADDMQ